MNVRMKFEVHIPTGYTNSELVRLIKRECQKTSRIAFRICSKFKSGKVTIAFSDLGGYEDSHGFDSDLIMYRHAISEVVDCPIDAYEVIAKSFLKPMSIEFELVLTGGE